MILRSISNQNLDRRKRSPNTGSFLFMKGDAMKNMKLQKLTKASPTILSCLAAAGVIGTAILAARSTPKALWKIREDSKEKHDGDPNVYTAVEAVKSAWICYIPAAITGAATIVCIFGANVLNRQQQASLASAYALLNDSYQNYKSKLKELYGDETHQKIVDAIAVEKAGNVYISAPNLVGSSSLTLDEPNPEDIRLFYDSFSNRYFESTLVNVMNAEYHLNRNYALGYGVCINDLYRFLGIDIIPGGDELEWFWSDGLGWIDFDHHKTTLDDGLEVCIVDLVFEPRLATDDD